MVVLNQSPVDLDNTGHCVGLSKGMGHTIATHTDPIQYEL
jgi:hypothetical protein